MHTGEHSPNTGRNKAEHMEGDVGGWEEEAARGEKTRRPGGVAEIGDPKPGENALVDAATRWAAQHSEDAHLRDRGLAAG